MAGTAAGLDAKPCRRCRRADGVRSASGAGRASGLVVGTGLDDLPVRHHMDGVERRRWSTADQRSRPAVRPAAAGRTPPARPARSIESNSEIASSRTSVGGSASSSQGQGDPAGVSPRRADSRVRRRPSPSFGSLSSSGARPTSSAAASRSASVASIRPVADVRRDRVMDIIRVAAGRRDDGSQRQISPSSRVPRRRSGSGRGLSQVEAGEQGADVLLPAPLAPTIASWRQRPRRGCRGQAQGPFVLGGRVGRLRSHGGRPRAPVRGPASPWTSHQRRPR